MTKKPELMNDGELLHEIICLWGKPSDEAQGIMSEALVRLFNEYVKAKRRNHMEIPNR